MIDLDHFKTLNDSAGHQAGDRALAEVARRLSTQARSGDLVARLGGDEFAWLIPEAGGWSALQAADRAREAIMEEPLADGAYLSASAGVAELGTAPDPAEFTRWADQALYLAKRNGRDVAFLYSPEVVDALSGEDGAEDFGRLRNFQGVRVLARAANARSPYPRGHAERVADLAISVAAGLGWDSAACASLREAALVHDIGLIAVPESALAEGGDLTDAQRSQVEAHAEIGAALVAAVMHENQVAWVRGHHERWDGTGYPDGLRGAAIPEGSRVLAAAGAFVVAMSPPPAGSGLCAEDALLTLEEDAGSGLWPAAVEEISRLVADGAIQFLAQERERGHL